MSTDAYVPCPSCGGAAMKNSRRASCMECHGRPYDARIPALRAENAALREGYVHVGDHDLGTGTPRPIYACPECEAIFNAGDAHMRDCSRRPVTTEDPGESGR